MDISFEYYRVNNFRVEFQPNDSRLTEEDCKELELQVKMADYAYDHGCKRLQIHFLPMKGSGLLHKLHEIDTININVLLVSPEGDTEETVGNGLFKIALIAPATLDYSNHDSPEGLVPKFIVGVIFDEVREGC